MNTPYLDQEISLLQGYKYDGSISLYQKNKLSEYKKIKEQLSKHDKQ